MALLRWPVPTVCPSRFSLFSWPQVGQNPCRCFIYGSLPCTYSLSRLSLSKQLTSYAVDMDHLRQSDEPLPKVHCAHIHRHTVIRKMRKEMSPRGFTYRLWVSDSQRPGHDLVPVGAVLATGPQRCYVTKADNFCKNYNSVQAVQLLSPRICALELEPSRNSLLLLHFENC